MAASEQILSAVRCNWWLNAVGILLSYGASIVLVRALPSELFAQYAAMMAIIGLATLAFEGGANSGLTRYFHEASLQNSRGTFYRALRRKRLVAAALCGVILWIAGPIYARFAHFEALGSSPWLFIAIAGIVAFSLLWMLAHYGLLAMFEPKVATFYQQGFLVLRSLTLAVIACASGDLQTLVLGVLVCAIAQAVVVDRSLWQRIAKECDPLPAAFVSRAQTFGWVSVFDKLCAMLGSGTVALLVFAPHHAVGEMAFLGLAVDLIGKLVSFTVLPMGNLVGPYLGQTPDGSKAQGLAAARIIKLSSLLYSASVGLGFLLLPDAISWVYGARYHGAAVYALLLLIPTAFESWVRGCCSPVLLRNNRYRALMRVNVLQAVLTSGTMVLVLSQPLEIALLCVGVVRCAATAVNLVTLRGIVPRGTYWVPFQGALISAAGWAICHGLGLFFPVPLRPLAQALLFSIAFLFGLRQLIFRDEDTQSVVQRILGGQLKLLTRFLARRPVSSV